MNLENNSPVVLSACNTALGAIGRGDEVIRLQAAFHEFRISNIIATQGEISDESTAAPMEKFYSSYLNGENTGAALADTVRTIPDKHPRHWAAFQLWGTINNDKYGHEKKNRATTGCWVSRRQTRS